YDVAFHVDTTQRRKRYPTEESLNAVRLEYIERVRGLGIAVIFNTTVHASNLDEIPRLARFFLERSDVVGMASFQVQAATGRGVEGREGGPLRSLLGDARDRLPPGEGLGAPPRADRNSREDREDHVLHPELHGRAGSRPGTHSELLLHGDDGRRPRLDVRAQQ